MFLFFPTNQQMSENKSGDTSPQYRPKTPAIHYMQWEYQFTCRDRLWEYM